MGVIFETGQRLAAALLLTGLLATPVLAQESPIRDQDRSTFDTLYSEKLSTVNRTRSTSDDKTLANEIFGFAAALPDSDAGVQCLVYQNVISLSSNTGELGLMQEAYALLQDRWPEQDLVSPEQLMQFASRGYRAVDRSGREEQGEHYIDMLLIVAQSHEDANDPEQAISVCRLANTVAKTIASDRLEAIEDKLEGLASAVDMAKRIKMLELSVQKNPQNSPAARELVKLLVTKHDDPVAAATYVDSTSDEELIDLVKRCALGIDVANAATAMRVADWYLGLAEDEDGELALSLLNESREWYEQFFTLYERDDALARRVAEMDNVALLKIERLIEANPELIGKSKEGWVPLTAPPYDAEKFKIGEAEVLNVEDGEITIKECALLIPFDRVAAYEIRMIVTVNEDASEARPAFTLHLPIGRNRLITTRYFIDHLHIAQIDEVTEQRLIEPAPAEVGEKTELIFQVAEEERDVAFAMLYNGRAGVKWQGRAKELEEINEEVLERIPKDLGPVMMLYFNANVTLHSVEYKPRS